MGIFLVMEWVELDLKQLFSQLTTETFHEEHIKVILYNLLCTVNYLETANVMHRDIKPSNIMINDMCAIKICDFGMARSLPQELASDYDLSKYITDSA